MQKKIVSDQNSLIKKAAYLRIKVADLADGMKSGNFRSLYRGQGVDFSGVREYTRGDDIRSIDWNVTARMGHPFIKIFEEERELQIFIVLDTSLSMNLKNDERTKYEVASETAALITMAAEINSCPVGAVFFDGAIHFSCKPKQAKEQTMMILTHLDKPTEHQVKGSVLGNALTGAGKLLRKRSLVFVISDFKAGNWEKSMISLAQKNDVIAIYMQDSTDDQLPSVGTATFTDVESNLKMELPSSSESFKKEWRNYNQQQLNRWKDFCIKHGVYSVILNTKNDPLQVLNSVFARKIRSR